MASTQQRQYAVCVHRRVRVRVRIASLIVCYCRYVASSKGTCIYVSRLNAITVSMLICKIIIHTHKKKSNAVTTLPHGYNEPGTRKKKKNVNFLMQGNQKVG